MLIFLILKFYYEKIFLIKLITLLIIYFLILLLDFIRKSCYLKKEKQKGESYGQYVSIFNISYLIHYKNSPIMCFKIKLVISVL